jgi:hypothetical protein
MRSTFRLVAGLLLLPAGLAAQVGATTDILTGVVTDGTGAPVAQIVVEATAVETEIVRGARTDARGRYTILFPDGGGQYRLTFRGIGFQPVTRIVVRYDDEDRLVTNVQLSAIAAQLAEVRVEARRPPPVGGIDAPTPGTTERVLTPEQLARLPIDASDLALLALLAPGVVSVAGTDSTAAGFSVAGQRPEANATTLDGASFGGSSVPQEGLRSSRVITNSYDVARGQFSGGQVSLTSRGGNNLTQGSFTWGLRDEELTFGDDARDPFARGYSQNQISGGAGTAIIRNKLFIFGSGQGRIRNDAFQTLLNAPSSTLDRLGTNADSAARFIALAAAAGSPIPTTLLDTRSSDDYTSLLRLDWTVSQSHSLSLRGDGRYNRQDPTRTSGLALPEVAGNNKSTAGGVQLTMSSRFGFQVLNEFRAYLNGSEQEGTPFNALPQGRVQVTSEVEGGGFGVATYQFGGNPGAARKSRASTLEASNEVSWIPSFGGHRFKLGLLYKESDNTQDVTSNRYGTYTYQSLADLEANRPSTFSRTLAPTVRSTTGVDQALYLGDVWRTPAGIQITLGARLERSSFKGVPAYNPEAETLFGIRTDRLPTETHFSPRLGVSYTPNGGGQGEPPKYSFRGGFGDFRSPIPSNLVGSAQAATGLSAAETQLYCLGDAVPLPDWQGFRSDANAIPTGCAGAASPLPTRLPGVTVFDEHFVAARAWRASVGVTRRFGIARSLNLNLSWARGVGQSGVTDLNLGTRQFALANEAGRPVYADAASISTLSGAVLLAASRREAQYGQVFELDSELGSKSLQATVGFNGAVLSKGILYNISYTASHVTDQGSGGNGRGFGGQNTAGDPNERDWARSDFARTHSLLATVTWPISSLIELTTISRLSSGQSYTPMVSGDVNGDGSRNDRAFVFDPAAAGTDPAIAEAMGRLLSSTSGGARECLATQMGQIATRNSCLGPWQPSIELQLNLRPNLFGLERRLAISITTQNLLGGIDQLVHGADGIKGWGQATRPDGTLLYVRGFDANTSQFQYQVNERFGATGVQGNAIRIPFQVGIQARLSLGPNRPGSLGQIGGRGFGGGRGGGGGIGGGGIGGGGFGGGGDRGAAGGPGGGAGIRGLLAPGDSTSFLARFTGLVANPAQQIIDRRIQLRLTEAQVTALTIASDSFNVGVVALAQALEEKVAGLGANPDPQRAMTLIRPAMTGAQALRRQALEAAQKVLTPEQWGALPAALTRQPPAQGGPGAQRRPPGG